MIDTEFYGYRKEDDGTYTVLKNNEVYIRGIADAMSAAYIVEQLQEDSPDPIIDLGECELLCQLAEEAAELAHAALKLRRVIEKENPTPCTEEECREHLNEEVADVDLLFKLLNLTTSANINRILKIEKAKRERWIDRLQSRAIGEEHG